MKRSITFTFIFVLNFLVSYLNAQSWQQLNGPWAGSFSKLVSNNSTTATVFAGGNSGIYKSTDNGVDWIKVSASDGSLITQNNASPNFIISKSERSIDGGATWTGFVLPSEVESYNIKSIITNQNNSSRIYLLSNYKLYTSSNSGTNWTISDDSSGSYPYYSNVVQMSVNPSTIVYTIGYYGYIRKSTDNGTTWIAKKYTDDSFINSQLSAEVDLQNSNVLYIGRDNKIYKTTNGGTTWTSTIVGGYNITSIAIHKSNSNIVYVSHENGISKSTNAGTSWTTIFQNKNFEQITSLVALANNNLLKTSYSQGIFLSTDGGIIFRSVGGEQVIANGMKFQNSDNTIITWDSRGVYIGTNSGTNWKLCLAYGAYGENGLSIHPTSINNWIVSTNNYEKELYFTTDGGDNWVVKNFSSIESSNEVFYNPANANQILLKSYSDIARSLDNGNYWTLLAQPLPGENLELLTFNKTNQNQFYASANSCVCIVRSDDAGSSWYSFRDGIEENFYGNYISDLEFDPQNSNVIYATSGGLYKIILPSATWNKIYEPSTEFLYTPGKLLIDPSNSQKMYSLYSACTMIGSTNGGVNWGKANLGIEDKYKTTSSAFISLTGKIYLSTGAGVVYGNPVITDISEDNTFSKTFTEFSLNQNFPNPANPFTTISYTLPNSSDVSLVVYDILGNEVSTLVNQNQESGEYSIEFNAMDFASGVYIYKLHAGDFVQTRKMILLK